jgi:hypothetical protein
MYRGREAWMVHVHNGGPNEEVGSDAEGDEAEAVGPAQPGRDQAGEGDAPRRGQPADDGPAEEQAPRELIEENTAMRGPSFILRVAAVVVFVLATVGVAPVPMTPLGLALWCGSTLVP